jgi:hypothetical protein
MRVRLRHGGTRWREAVVRARGRRISETKKKKKTKIRNEEKKENEEKNTSTFFSS